MMMTRISIAHDSPKLWVAYTLLKDTQLSAEGKKRKAYYEKHGYPKNEYGDFLFTLSALEIEKLKENPKNIDYKKRGFIEINVHQLSRLFSEQVTANALKFLLKVKVLQEVHTLKYLALDPIERGLIKEEHFRSQDVQRLDDFIINPAEISKAEENDEEVYWEYRIMAKEKQLQDYIDRYIHLWKNDQCITHGCNILKSEIQISRVVRSIFDLLSMHPDNDLLLTIKQTQEADYFATALFLEQIGDITIDKTVLWNVSNNAGVLKIDILPKFYEDFKVKFGQVIFDLQKLKTPSELEKFIVFDGVKILRYKKKAHLLRENSFSLLLMTALNTKGKTNYSELVDSFKKKGIPKTKEGLRKDLKNFRTSLRNTFGLSQKERFVEIRDEEFIPNSELFYFFKPIEQQK